MKSNLVDKRRPGKPRRTRRRHSNYRETFINSRAPNLGFGHVGMAADGSRGQKPGEPTRMYVIEPQTCSDLDDRKEGAELTDRARAGLTIGGRGRGGMVKFFIDPNSQTGINSKHF